MTTNNQDREVFPLLFWTFVLFQLFTGTLAGGPFPTEDRELCQKSEVEACRKLGFLNISMSNIFGWTAAQIEIEEEVERLMPLVETGCSRDLLALICAAYLPACDYQTGERMPPCKDSCRKIINQKCKGQMKRLGFKSEEVFGCRNYPSRREERECLTDLSLYREQESNTTATPSSTTSAFSNTTVTISNTTPNFTKSTTSFSNSTSIEGTPMKEEPHIPSVIFTVERSASNDGWVLVRDPKPNNNPEVSGFEVIYYNDRSDDAGETMIHGQDQIHLTLNSDAAYTVLTRAFNQTDVGSYEDARMEPYIHPHCEEITFSTLRSLCANVNYRHVQYPSGSAFSSQADAANLIAPVEKMLRSMDSKCADFMKQFLCTVYAPPCVRIEPGMQEPLLPCRELCQRVVDSCNADPTAEVFSEMGFLNCTNFPSKFDVNATCYSNEVEISMWPLIDDRGQVITEGGSKVSAFCSASCRNCTRPQWFDPNGREITTEGIENGIKEVYSTNVGTFTSMLTITSLNSSWVGEYICLFNNQEKIMIIQLSGTPTLSPEANVFSNQSTTANATITSNFTMISNATEMNNVTKNPTPNVTIIYNDTAQSVPSFMNDTSREVTIMNYTMESESNITESVHESQNTSTSIVTTSLTNSSTPSQSIPALIGNTTLLGRSYIIDDRGMTSFFRGWVDVQGQGAPNDFCRIVRTDGKPFMSCLLAGSTEDDVLAYTSPNPSEEWFDPGYSNTWYMKDEDGDGRDDYCRCVGSVPETSVVCVKAGPAGFEGQERDFTPETSPKDCFYLTADPFFGFP